MDPTVFPTVFGIVIGGLMVAAITGNVAMYRQVGVLNQAVIDLTKTLDAFSKRAMDEQVDAVRYRDNIKRQLDELERQMLDVQSRVGVRKDRGSETREN